MRYGSKFDINQLTPEAILSVRLNRVLFNHITQNTNGLRDKLTQAEKARDTMLKKDGIIQRTPTQTVVTAMLYGRNDGGNNLPTDFEIKHSEKIQNEKRRLAGYVE
jgi:hypothetical protein